VKSDFSIAGGEISPVETATTVRFPSPPMPTPMIKSEPDPVMSLRFAEEKEVSSEGERRSSSGRVLKRPRGKSLAGTGRTTAYAAKKGERAKLREKQALAPAWRRSTRSRGYGPEEESDDDIAEEGAQLMTEMRRTATKQYQQRQQAYMAAWWHQQQLAMQYMRRHSMPAAFPLAPLSGEPAMVYYVPNPANLPHSSDIRSGMMQHRPSVATAANITPSDHSAFESIPPPDTAASSSPKFSPATKPEKTETPGPAPTIDTQVRPMLPPSQYYFPALQQQRWIAYQNYVLQHQQAYYPAQYYAWPSNVSQMSSTTGASPSPTPSPSPSPISSLPPLASYSLPGNQPYTGQPVPASQQDARVLPPIVWHSPYTPSAPPPGFKANEPIADDMMSVDQSSSSEVSADVMPASPVANTEPTPQVMQ
jgi:hypothetical protein